MTFIEMASASESGGYRVHRSTHKPQHVSDWSQALATWVDALAAEGLWTTADGQLYLTSHVKSLVCTLIGPGDVRVTLALARNRRGRRSPLQVQSIGHGVTLSYHVGPGIEKALEAWTRAATLSSLLSPTRTPTERLHEVICRAWVTAPNTKAHPTPLQQEASSHENPRRQHSP